MVLQCAIMEFACQDYDANTNHTVLFPNDFFLSDLSREWNIMINSVEVRGASRQSIFAETDGWQPIF